MKRFYFIFLFLFTLISLGFCQDYSEIVEYKTDQGDTVNFKMIKKSVLNSKGLLETEFDYQNNSVIKYYYFDTLVDKKEIWKGDTLAETQRYSFDLNNNLILIETYFKTSVLSKDVFIFDKNNFLIEEIHFYKDSTGERTEYSNNHLGKDTLEIEWQLDENGIWEKTCESTSKWNSNGKIIEWKNSVCNPVRNALETWEWDNQGRLIRKQTFTEEGKLYRDYVYKHVSGGYEIVSTGYNYDGSEKHLDEKSWEYQPQYFTYCTTDNKGRLIKEKVVDEKGNLFSLRIFRYNEKGNLIRKTYCNGDGTLNYSSKYEFK